MAIVQELSLVRTAEAVQKVATAAARELMNADGATFVLRSGEECHYVDEDAVAPLWMGSRFPLTECVSGWVMEHRQPVVIPDIYADDRVPAEAYRSRFVKSLAIVPIRAEEPIGAIGAYWAQEHVAAPEEVELLRELADCTAIALENVKLYAQLSRDAEEHARAADAARQSAEEHARSGEEARQAEQAARRELAKLRHAEGALTRVEQRLGEAQKMEAIGRFAGGIAHDFNNMLSVILSYCSLALQEAFSGEPVVDCIEEIQKAGERAAQLTQQLLAFSGRQPLQRQRVDLNRVVSDVEKMLEPVLGDGVRLEVRRASVVHPVMSDVGQLQQVLLALVLRARDAMPDGGRVIVETRDVVLGEDEVRRHVGARPGPHGMLAVSDTGAGMDGDTQLHVFEPFFVPKAAGAYGGLGLANAYSVVKQSGGALEVESTPGRGTTFRAFLPRWEPTRRFREDRPYPGLAH